MERFCAECALEGNEEPADYPTSEGWLCWDHRFPSHESAGDRRKTHDEHRRDEVARRLAS
jgi:hypothetical protein